MGKAYLIVFVIMFICAIYSYTLKVDKVKKNKTREMVQQYVQTQQMYNPQVIPYDCPSCYVPKQTSEGCFNKLYNATGDYYGSINSCELPRKMSESCMYKKML